MDDPSDGRLPLRRHGWGRPGIVAELLGDGADPQARDGTGRQAIDLATDPAIRALLAGSNP
jgi:hypothetical protein